MFVAALVSINNPGLATYLSFTITTDKNRMLVRCVEGQNRKSMTCTIMISGSDINIKLISSNIIKIYWSLSEELNNVIVSNKKNHTFN